MAMTPEQTQELHKAVEQRRAALMAEVSEDLHKVREDRVDTIVGAVPDPGDASRDITELRMLEAARERMAQGTYGICINCGLDIGFERLRANPAAERCINCQTQYEKTHAQPTGTKL